MIVRFLVSDTRR
jgi:hypothetical protein